MRYFRGLILSLGFHIALALFISYLPGEPENNRLSLKPSYVELLEQPELSRRPKQPARDTKQIVRSVDVPDEVVTKEKKKTQFSSEEERYVFEEQRARLTDLSKNRGGLSADSSRDSQPRKSAKRKKIDFNPESALESAQKELMQGHSDDDVKLGGLDKQGKAERAQESEPSALLKSMIGAERGLSTFGEVAPDSLKFGDFTALNTDRHLYYSFYSRMEEKIRHRWVSYARAAIYNMTPEAQRRASGKDSWVTKLEIILDPQGRFVKAILTESSGSKSLDSAPVQAFKDAYQFPNPPKEMIQDDGNIHISYAFNVNIVVPRYADRE